MGALVLLVLLFLVFFFFCLKGAGAVNFALLRARCGLLL